MAQVSRYNDSITRRKQNNQDTILCRSTNKRFPPFESIQTSFGAYSASCPVDIVDSLSWDKSARASSWPHIINQCRNKHTCNYVPLSHPHLWHVNSVKLKHRSNFAVFLLDTSRKHVITSKVCIWQIVAGGFLLRSGQTQVGEPKIGEHAQWHYFASVTTQTLW
jgi:hypothetical protein